MKSLTNHFPIPLFLSGIHSHSADILCLDFSAFPASVPSSGRRPPWMRTWWHFNTSLPIYTSRSLILCLQVPRSLSHQLGSPSYPPSLSPHLKMKWKVDDPCLALSVSSIFWLFRERQLSIFFSTSFLAGESKGSLSSEMSPSTFLPLVAPVFHPC